MGRITWKALAFGVLLLSCATIFGFLWLVQRQHAQLESLAANPELSQEDLLSSISYPNSHFLKEETPSFNITEYYFETEDDPETVMFYLFDRLQEQGWLFSGWYEEGISFSYDQMLCEQQIAKLECYDFPSSGIHVSAYRERGDNITTIYLRFESVQMFEGPMYSRAWSIQ